MGSADAVVVVDAANVVGSRPDGWWRDRVGATRRLLEQLAPLAGTTLEVAGRRLHVARLVVVVEGAARRVQPVEGTEVVRAPADGDSTVVEVVRAELAADAAVVVVTADRGLRARLPDGADAVGPRWLLDAAARSE